jgi:hypothetical protein
MPQTYDQHRKRVSDRDSETLRGFAWRGDPPVIEMLRQAALSAANLTGDPHWNRFLSYFQSSVETTEGQRARLVEILTNSKVVEQNQIMETKIAIAECTARIEAWNAMMAFPNQIMEMHLAKKPESAEKSEES